MNNTRFVFIVAVLMTAIDFYVFQVVKMLCQTSSQKSRSIFFTTYWTVSIAIILLFVFFLF